MIHPIKYYRDFINLNVRPDGRELDQFRPVRININSIGTADGSAIVKLGHTTVVCGIKAVRAFALVQILVANYILLFNQCIIICRNWRNHQSRNQTAGI